MKNKEPFSSLEKYFGNNAKLAKLLEINQSNVSNWRRRNSIPYKYAVKINYLSKGYFKLSFLRPKEPEPFLSLFCHLGKSNLAKNIGITRQSISNWLRRGFIPEKYLKLLSDMSLGKLTIKFLGQKIK